MQREELVFKEQAWLNLLSRLTVEMHVFEVSQEAARTGLSCWSVPTLNSGQSGERADRQGASALWGYL